MNAPRIVVALLVAAGIAELGYQAGLAQGLAQGGGAIVTAPYYVAPFGFGFGFFGLLFPLLFLFLIFGLGRALFWRGWGGHGHAGGPRRWGDPQVMLEEWHRKAHGETAETSRPAPPERS